jgi:hypothetical protein
MYETRWDPTFHNTQNQSTVKSYVNKDLRVLEWVPAIRIEQKVEPIEVMTGIETENVYHIKALDLPNHMKNHVAMAHKGSIFFAKERSSVLHRMFMGNYRYVSLYCYASHIS